MRYEHSSLDILNEKGVTCYSAGALRLGGCAKPKAVVGLRHLGEEDVDKAPAKLSWPEQQQVKFGTATPPRAHHRPHPNKP